MSSVKIQGSPTGTANFTIAVPDGTSTDRTIELPDAAGSFVLADGSNNVAVTGDLTVDTNTLYVDSTNNRVGIGTASPSRNVSIVDSSVPLLQLAISTDQAAGNGFELAYDGLAAYLAQRENLPMVFKTNDSERARIDSSGNFLMGKTSASFGNSTAQDGWLFDASGKTFHIQTNANVPFNINRRTSTGSLIEFWYNTGVKGSISTNGSSVSYNTTSDYRLKENVTELTGAIDRVKQVPVHRFNFIADPDNTVDGFIAHEVADVVPEAIHGEKDAMKTEEYEVTPAVLDDDGNVVTEAVMGTREVPEYQGIDQSKLVPLLTAAIKEQQALIEDLQTRLAALEAV